ncbi:MAG TPA: fibrillarin-like rRNA/tRNA 2'-O-methyltransferase [archaeon]|jgi:fibrillarin-like pre-rRNA processing protein|nr:fibrillarin-like rRNA/tRNA 2'-O-methyltransferase [archaeon]
MENIFFENGLLLTKDLNTQKKRLWDPNRSKIAAGIKKGLTNIPFKKTDNILYLGAAEGYTISYISDIITDGCIYGIDISPHSLQKLYLLSLQRKNLIPIYGDANKPEEYAQLINGKIDFIIQDVSQKNQIEILKKNADLFLKDKGYILLSLKLSAISSGNEKTIIETEINNFKKNFEIIDMKKLDPFEKKHILILGRKK